MTRKAAKKTKKNPQTSAGVGHPFLFFIFKTALFTAFAGLFCVLCFIAYCYGTLPDPENGAKKTRAPQITVLDKDGYEIASFGTGYAAPVDLNDLPAYVAQAFIVTEDARFFEHGGIDPFGILRAIKTNLVRKRRAQGGSTITQQVAKNLFLSNEKSFKRKIQEMMLAVQLEHNLTKEQILSIYLNRVYFGSGAYGIESAARRYFGKSARDLTVYDAAMLAALMKAPSTYNPLLHPEKSAQRTKLVLKKMVQAGVITKKQAEALRPSPLTNARKQNGFARYYTDWVLRELDDCLGGLDEDAVVLTTLDSTLQQKTEEAVARFMPLADKKHATQSAVVVMDKNGAVLAMTGGRDYQKSQFNRATDALRQVGSTIKPFVYLTAFDKGSDPNDTDTDEKIDIGGWSPKNANGKYQGLMTLGNALVHSVNTIAVKTAVKAGLSDVLKTARKFGAVGDSCKPEAALALGVCAVRPIDLVAAYASLANGGYGVTPHAIVEVRNLSDDVLYARRSDGRPRLINPRAIVLVDDLLRRVIEEGTGKKAFPGILAKGKTGTTQNYRDAWFVGYTQEIAAGVWLGNDNDSPTDKVAGGGLPAELWRTIVKPLN